MAVFNPQDQPINIPNWERSSHPIGDVAADKSTGMLLSTIGEAVETGTKIADTAVKYDIKTQAQEGVDNLRDAYTDSLKQIRGAQIAGGPQSLLPDEATGQPPQGLSNGLDRAKNIGTALAQGGTKINDTLYTGALNSLTKQLRSQYPGYRDYIDEQIQSVSGVNPANAFYKNLMEDINRNAENNKSEINATRTMLRSAVSEGFHDTNGVSAAQVLRGYDAGAINIDQVNTWYNGARKLEFDTKAKATARANRQGDEADSAVMATKDLSSMTAQTIAQATTTLTIGKGTDTFEGMAKFIQANAGNQAVKDERSQAIGQQMVAMRNQMFNTMMSQANEGGSNSIVAKLGGDPEKAAKVINGQLATLDLAITQVFNKDWGSAYSHMNFNKAISQDSTNLLYNAPDEEVRKYNRMVGAINNISPQFGMEFFKNSLLGNVPQGEKEFLKKTQMELLTQPDKPMGKLTSVNESIQNSKAAGAKSPKTYDELIKSVDMVSNPKIGLEQRMNIAESFFNPVYNQGLLSDKNFVKDQYDPTLKRTIPGKYSVFRKLTSENVAAGINELGKTNPDIVDQYHTMLSREFGEQLFSRELRDLAEVNQTNLTQNAPYKIKFVDDKARPPHFEAVRPDGSPMTMGEATMMEAPTRSLNRLNEGMSSLWTSFKGTGVADPTNEVMKNIYRYNYQDPEKSPQGWTPGGAVRTIWNAIMSAQNEKLRQQGEMMRK